MTNLVENGALIGMALLDIPEVATPSKKDLKGNLVWIKPVVELNPWLVPSYYYLADAFLILDKKLKMNLLTHGGQTLEAKSAQAVVEGSRLRKLCAKVRRNFMKAQETSHDADITDVYHIMRAALQQGSTTINVEALVDGSDVEAGPEDYYEEPEEEEVEVESEELEEEAEQPKGPLKHGAEQNERQEEEEMAAMPPEFMNALMDHPCFGGDCSMFDGLDIDEADLGEEFLEGLAIDEADLGEEILEGADLGEEFLEDLAIDEADLGEEILEGTATPVSRVCASRLTSY